jgi:RNA polymerase sigma-70 factor, ECF subfamily
MMQIDAVQPQPVHDAEEKPACSLEDLLDRVANGQRDAFAELYDRMAPAVYGIAKRVLRNKAMAEEVAHDALLDIWMHCRAFDRSRGSARAWILTIAHRRAVDAVRSEQASRDRDAREALRAWERPRDVVAEAVMQTLGVARVRKSLDQLTPVQRSAIQLAYYDAHTHREVALLLDVPLGTAKSRICDGLSRLRRDLTDQG